MENAKCVAMILAGGQGSRLGALTKHIAKPAVPFGGKYRIIDFVLTNCTHSGIHTVGVLTQYRPLDLNTYIGSGKPWDLDRSRGGVYILPPYMKSGEGEWYRGTANAIYQNMGFIERFDPRYVLVLSGDHIYKMHYGKMLAKHKEKGAAASLAVIRVKKEEASRFGIMEADENGFITDFEEKPKEPKSDLASMGVYIFDRQVLKKYLILDEGTRGSKNDFGKDVIPRMLRAGERLYAYPFDGYWKDVGTAGSLWEANMDVISTPPKFDLYDPDWPIFSRSTSYAPHYVAESAQISESIVSEGCRVYGILSGSVLFKGARVDREARVKKSVIFPDAHIEKGAVVENAIVGSGAVVRRGVRVEGKGEEVVVIGDGEITGMGGAVMRAGFLGGM